VTTYLETSLGVNLSQLVQKIDAQNEAIRSYERGSTEPTVKPIGLLWDCTDGTRISGLGLAGVTEAVLRWTGSAWTIHAVVSAPALSADGKVPASANIPMGTKIFTGLGAGSDVGHSVRYEQTMLLSGVNAMGADLNMGTHKIVNVVDPTNPQEAATKAYVDTKGGNAFFQSTGASGSETPIDSGQIYGDPDSSYIERVQKATFPAEFATLLFKGQIYPRAGASPLSDNWHARLEIPRVRVPASADNGGVFRAWVGKMSNDGTTWTDVYATWDITTGGASTLGDTPAKWDGETDAFTITSGAIKVRWRWFDNPATGYARGFAFWFVKASDSSILALDEVGGAGDEGIVQLFLR
jgi:hypothetical protein